MIYENNFVPNNQFPKNIQDCIDNYQEALENYAMNDYKMRLNANNRDVHGMPNHAYRNAMEDRSNALDNMRKSMKTAFILAREEANISGNINIIDKLYNKFQSILDNSVFYKSNAYEFNIEGFFGITKQHSVNIEEQFKNQLNISYHAFGLNPKRENPEPKPHLDNEEDYENGNR